MLWLAVLKLIQVVNMCQQIFVSRMLKWPCVLLGLFCNHYKTLILELVILDMVFYSVPLADFANVLVIYFSRCLWHYRVHLICLSWDKTNLVAILIYSGINPCLQRDFYLLESLRWNFASCQANSHLHSGHYYSPHDAIIKAVSEI